PIDHDRPLPVLFLLMMGAFLLFWLSLWTVGGITAMGELLRLVWSEDRIVAGPAGITLHTSRGPFRKKVDIPRDEVRAIVPSARGSALAVETPRNTIVLTRNGTQAEREEVAATLRLELGLKDEPPGASTTWTPGMAPMVGVIALGMAALAAFVVRKALGSVALIPPAVIVTAFALGLAWLAFWLA